MTMPMRSKRPRRPNMRRAVLLFPSGLTLFNLFFGVFAIITASLGNFSRAGIYVLVGGIFDALDGRVARATNAGSQFGEELDSLVDAISFGLAPAMIMYFAVLKPDGWQWVFVFLFTACAVLRLARFNVEQAGTAKTYFQGLPSPAAGCTLASYYWFSQSKFYTYGAIGNLPWDELLRFLMAALAFLMISNVPYPVMPRAGVRSFRAIGASVVVFGSLALLTTGRLEYFFPLCLIYVAWGLFRWVFSGLFERRQPTIPYDLSEGEGDEDDEDDFEVAPPSLRPNRQGHRETRGVRDDKSRALVTRDEAPVRTSRGDERPPRPERPARPDRASRPPRTDAEKAARREKREMREKRDQQRQQRAAQPQADGAPVDAGIPLAPISEVVDATSVTTSEEAGIVPAEASSDAVARTRKRKRRRRRGERKDRPAAAADGDSGGSDGEADSFENTASGREDFDAPTQSSEQEE